MFLSGSLIHLFLPPPLIAVQKVLVGEVAAWLRLKIML